MEKSTETLEDSEDKEVQCKFSEARRMIYREWRKPPRRYPPRLKLVSRCEETIIEIDMLCNKIITKP